MASTTLDKRRQRIVDECRSSCSQKPSRRSNTARAINYDMKFHPMDDILRPGVVALRRIRKANQAQKQISILKRSTQSKLPDVANVMASEARRKVAVAEVLPIETTKDLEVIRPESTGKPEKRAMFNNLKPPLASRFCRMGHFDQRLYVLQQGASPIGNRFPLSWPEVIAKLRDDDLLTIRQLQAWGGTKALKTRYAAIHDEMAKSFGIDVENAASQDSVFMWAEDTHVLKQQPGTKYWTHYQDSILVSQEDPPLAHSPYKDKSIQSNISP